MGPLLAIDTSSRQASLALFEGPRGRIDLIGWWSLQASALGREVAPRVVDLLKTHQLRAADLAAVAVALGPGSFTGLRAGMSLAKGFSLAGGIPLLGIPTADAVAHMQEPIDLPLWAILDAGRGRICVSGYRHQQGQWRRASEYRLTTWPALWGELRGPALVCGELSTEGFEPPAGAGDGLTLRPSGPRAAAIAALAWERYTRGEVDDPIALEPFYLPTPAMGA
ncbi:MAG: tRNA (adenosine(37)-N6)-threonylcarbamoyltransferase complex dimerization subunit type 1 TsaB [Chloroflexi bacterium]|nr:tRNA (adenosine(37)-N6)-threonylcarbamoyltransferase complex dimerization subunit type 1 TsaB [Chloroflexota bacterium]